MVTPDVANTTDESGTESPDSPTDDMTFIEEIEDDLDEGDDQTERPPDEPEGEQARGDAGGTPDVAEDDSPSESGPENETNTRDNDDSEPERTGDELSEDEGRQAYSAEKVAGTNSMDRAEAQEQLFGSSPSESTAPGTGQTTSDPEPDFGGPTVEREEKGDSSDDSGSSSSSSSSSRSSSKSDESREKLEESIINGAAALAVLGLEDEAEKNALEEEFSYVFEQFDLGYWGGEFLEEYVFVSPENDTDPAFVLMGQLIAATALVLFRRPDGKDQVMKLKDRIKEIREDDS